MAHQSDSSEQLSAEALVLAALSAELDKKVEPQRLQLADGARVDVDGVAEDESVLVEVFAHQGRLRGGQFHKVARDALKLITLARDRRDARLIIAFADEEAADCVRGSSWLSEALRTWQIEVYVAEIDETVREGIRTAQARQVMVNPEAKSEAVTDRE